MLMNSNEVKNVFSVLYMNDVNDHHLSRKVFKDKVSRNIFMDNLMKEGKDCFTTGYTPIVSWDVI